MLHAPVQATERFEGGGLTTSPAVLPAHQAPPMLAAPGPSNQALLRRLRQRTTPTGDGAPLPRLRDVPVPSQNQPPAAVLQRCSDGRNRPAGIPHSVDQVLRSPGHPLNDGERTFFASRFGRDFHGVRLHTDAPAAASARAVNARAYTVGQDIVFGAGQYQADSAVGRRLLAHELTHTVQQSGAAGAATQPLAINREDDPSEREADAVAIDINQTIPAPPDVMQEPPRLSRDVDEAITGESNDGGLQDTHDLSNGLAGGTGNTSVVYMCSKSLDTSPAGSHAFFRTGAPGKGNTTYSLQPIDTTLGADCWQGVPDKDYPSDLNVDGKCEKTAISLSCLENEFAAYPVGHYCTLGPNSNTFVGHIARRCGIKNPDPPGWTPGIDDNPPPSGTYAPDKWTTLFGGCSTKQCIIDAPREPPTG